MNHLMVSIDPLGFRKLLDSREQRDDSNQLGPFEASGLAFAMVMANLYDLQVISKNLPSQEDKEKHNCSSFVDQPQETFSEIPESIYILPLLLREACKDLNLTNLSHSGWVQFYLYQTLYCCDVEKPECEEEIKRVRNRNTLLEEVQQNLG